MHVGRLVSYLGGRVSTKLSIGITHLVSAAVDDEKEPSGAKVIFAREHGILIVGWRWLVKFGEAAVVVPAVEAGNVQRRLVEMEDRTELKGNGTEVVVSDEGPTDITNRPRKAHGNATIAPSLKY